MVGYTAHHYPVSHAGASEAVFSAKELEDTWVQGSENKVDAREQADSLIAKAQTLVTATFKYQYHC